MPTRDDLCQGLPARPRAPSQRPRWRRERAELLQARRREQQRQEQEREEAAARAARDVLRQAARPDAPDLDDIFAWLLTRPDANRRIQVLARLLGDRAPDLLDRELAGPLRRLVACAWQRPAEGWPVRGKSRHTRLVSLVDHLLVVYRVPRFLYHVLLGPEQHRKRDLDGARLFAHLAAGGSMREAVRKRWVPLPLTRRMGHLFLQAPADASLDLAARRAQVLAQGGDARLAPVLAASLDDRPRNGTRAFWWEAVAWLCRQRDLDLAEVGPVIDFLDHAVDEDRGHDLAGRTLPALRRAMAAWHAELAQIRRLHGVVFQPSGFAPGRWVRQRKVGERIEVAVWTLEEILTSRDLVREGSAQRHCVATYVPDVREGRAAIWSLRRDGHRMLTVEVRPARNAIVQVRGRGNRLARPGELELLKRWARANGLELADRI